MSSASYEEHRNELIRARLTTTAAAVFVLTVVFEVVTWVMVPEQWRAEWLSNIGLLAVAPLAIVLAKTPLQRRPLLLFSLMDAAYSVVVLLRFFDDVAWTSGIAAFTSIKLMGTAVLMPWSPLRQTASAALTLALYWVLFWYSGRMAIGTGEMPHQLTSPSFAALLSIIGVVGADRLRRQLFEQRRAAEHEAKVSSHFAATMSHELRNLMAAVHGYGEMLALEAGDNGGAASQSIPERLQLVARHGLEVINMTLDLSRAQSGDLAVHLEDTRIDQTFELLREEFARAPRQDSVRLDWELPAEDLRFRTDPIKLAMVLRNLVGNALKFTTKGEVRVAARRRDDALEITVSDTGAGIAPAEIATIFEPFYQGKDSERTGSAGLGLYVVKRLVTALGGTVTVESQPGRGAVFRVSVPGQ